MIKEFDKVKIIKSGKVGHVIEINDDSGRKPPLYLVEIEDKPNEALLSDVLIWCDWREIEFINGKEN